MYYSQRKFCFSPYTTHYSTFTCGKDYVSGHQLVIDYGELRQLDPCHPRYSRVASFPVELDVVCGVAICTGRNTHTHTPRCNHLSNHRWRPRYAALLIIQLACHLGRKKKHVWSFFQEPDVALESKSVNRFTWVHKMSKESRNSWHFLCPR